MHESMTVTELSAQIILMLDGAMGTMIQSMPLRDEDFMTDGHTGLRGCNEVLNLSRPDLIGDIHLAYLRAGAHIVETNTFGANRFSLAEYGLDDHVHDINLAGDEIARFAVERFTEEHPGSPAYVAGVVGPSGKSASLSPSVDDPAFRDVVFSDFVDAFSEQIGALLDGNVDLLLIETVLILVGSGPGGGDANDGKPGQSVPDGLGDVQRTRAQNALGKDPGGFRRLLSPSPVLARIELLHRPQEMIPLSNGSLRAVHSGQRPSEARFPEWRCIYSQVPTPRIPVGSRVAAVVNIVGGCCVTHPITYGAREDCRAVAAGFGKPEKTACAERLDSMRQEQGS